jgi:hypothetical protein
MSATMGGIFVTSRSPPGTSLRDEHVRMSVNTFSLLLWCETHHAEPVIGMVGLENPTVLSSTNSPMDR